MDGVTSPDIFLRSRAGLFESCAREGVEVDLGRISGTTMPPPERRRRESEAARQLAQALLARRGVPGAEIGRHAEGFPVWPDGWVGSLSHSSGWCAAAQARTPTVRGVGVDIENPARMKPAMWAHIATERERRGVEKMSPEEAACQVTAVFSAKEVVFKALFPLGGGVPGFLEVEIEWLGQGRFRTQTCANGPGMASVNTPVLHGIGGAFDGLVMAVGWVR